MTNILSEAGQTVFDARYAARDDEGNIIENFEQAGHRLAKVAAMAEAEEVRAEWEEKFANVILDRLFVPSTPIWANMGKTDRPWQPAACFVLDVEDSLEGMYQTLKDTAMVFKSGGGVGYNFSKIRPKGSLVRSTKGQASGVVELIKLYNASSEMVKQGGVRRGASMAILNIDHPEIIDFINAKLDGSLTNFNLSVGVTDAFMEALHNDGDWELAFDGNIHQTLPAIDLWQMISESAHACGDPGVIFVDRLQQTNPVPTIPVRATNPCGEQGLSPGECCLLGSMNLASMIDNNGNIDWDTLEATICLAVRFLDNMIDVAEYPLDFIDKATKITRKVGLGYTGLADLLIKAGLPYDSVEGRELVEEVTAFIQQTAHRASRDLGLEKGAFPAWEQSIYHTDDVRRNAACITVAPTGSVTTLAGCEGYGIEPLFAIAYTKETTAGTFNVFSPLFLEACEEYGISEDVLDEVAKKGSCQGVEGVPVQLQALFKGAQDIDPVDHVLMQASIQKFVDNAVSKTINLPNSATAEEIQDIYRLAYSSDLKGITVFRDGCKDGAITVGEKGTEEVKETESSTDLQRGEIMPRPETAVGVTHGIYTGCGKIYLTVNHQPNGKDSKVLETFITTGSGGGCRAYTEATSRMISLAIRGGISIEDIVEQLQSVHPCPSYMAAKAKGKELSPGSSCASAIARKLAKVSRQINGHEQQGRAVLDGGVKCPECGAVMKTAEGCYVCVGCGYSKC